MGSWQQQPTDNPTGPAPRASKDINMSSHQHYVDIHELQNMDYIPDEMTLDPRLSNASRDMPGNMGNSMANPQMLHASFWNPNMNNQMAFFDNGIAAATDMNRIHQNNQTVAPAVIASSETTIKTRSPSDASTPTSRKRSTTSSQSSFVSPGKPVPPDQRQKPRKESRKGKQQAPRQRKQSNASVSSRKISLQQEAEGLEDKDDSQRDRFLERNRIAASKCRQKKKVWVHDLEGSKLELENHHTKLQFQRDELVSELTTVKNMLMEHASCHDPNIDQWLAIEARNFVQRTAEKFSASASDTPESVVCAPRNNKRGE
jgi:hypothetical protein